MTNEEYIENVLRTESPKNPIVPRRLLHGTMGICTEAGELLDAVKKGMYYGKPMDYVNIREEIGDLLWYMALIIDEMGWSFEQIMEENINKLKTRYPEKFTEEKAINRDLETERKILEK